MATTENLKVKITADASQAKAEIGKFKDSLKETAGSAEKAVSSALKLKAALGALTAVKVAKAMIQNAVSVAAAGDEIKDNAQKVFMSTTAFQEWGYVLKQNGVDMSALKMGMRKFSQEVAGGSEKLAKYGITATDVETAFSQAVSAIQNMSTETERIAAATELFGTRALELMPVLNLTNAETQNLAASYRALGGTMSNELIAASDVCSDSILAMKTAWGGLRNVLAAYIIPVITKVVQWITVAIAYVRIFLKALFGIKETFGGKTGTSKKSIAGASASTAKNTGGIGKNLKKAAKHAKELRRTLMGIDELSRLAEKATAAAAGGGAGGGGAGGGGGVGGVGGVSVPEVGDVGTFDGIISDETLQKIQNFQEKIDKVKDRLHGAYLILKGVTELVFGNPVQGLHDIWEGIKLLLPDLDKLKEKWEEVKKKVAEKALTAKAVLEDKLSTAGEALKKKWEEIKKKFTDKKATITATLEDKFSTLFGPLKKKWDEAKEKFADKKATITASLSDKFSGSIDGFKEKWESAKAQITNKTATISGTLQDKFSGALAGFKKKWDAAKKKITSKSATISMGFTDKLKSGWNKLAKKVNAARKTALGKKLLPYMPYLAKGGILTEPTAAIMGEYPGARSNPEIATPQSLMYETIQRANGDLVSAFATMTRQVIAAIDDKDLSVKIGDEQIARSAQRGNAAYRSRTGKALITV